jgi:hypothetical protein
MSGALLVVGWAYLGIVGIASVLVCQRGVRGSGSGLAVVVGGVLMHSTAG